MKIARIISILLLLVTAISTFCIPGLVIAENATMLTPTPEPIPDSITISTQYPKIDGLATSTFQFNVDMNYKGAKDRIFDLKATVPQGWDVSVTPLYETTKKISSITMEASEFGKSQTLQITAGSLTWPLPNPGDYTITLEASSDNLVAKIDLTARVTAKYGLTVATTDNLYSMKAKSGRDNVLSIKVTNSGTATIENITYSSDKTQGWEITFKPESISSIEPLDTKTIDVNIKPAPKTVSGDYMISIWVSGKQVSADKISIRVTVETPSIWGWVGVIIIVIVVVGLILIFMRFGRR
ncbi:MAG: hypothetical protein A2Y90_06170 [Chloroflexi bacterium RBG_13_52_12]|nr:MAG: hypothetical protein A2Y90_06170 [Chloroflexi bacterium RBG_13_52_12]